MGMSEKIEVEGGRVTLSNGFPVSYSSPHVIGIDGIRALEMRVGGQLGHPVVCLTLRPSGEGGCEGEMFHPDSVMIKDNARQDSAFPRNDSDVLGLWNGADVSDLYELLLEAGLVGALPRHGSRPFTALCALRNRRLSGAEARRFKIGIEESRRAAYFRDQAGRCLLYCQDNEGTVVMCPDTSTLLAAMKFLKDTFYLPSIVRRYSEELTEMGCELRVGHYHEAE